MDPCHQRLNDVFRDLQAVPPPVDEAHCRALQAEMGALLAAYFREPTADHRARVERCLELYQRELLFLESMRETCREMTGLLARRAAGCASSISISPAFHAAASLLSRSTATRRPL